MVPNHARYQLRYTPDSFYIIITVGGNVKLNMRKLQDVYDPFMIMSQ